MALVASALLPGDAVRAASTPSVSLNVANVGPRQVEDTTQRSVARDYAAAWQAMADALDQNRADLLAANFIGTADERLTAGINDQQKTGLHQHIVDKGHHADVVFYSPEGSAMELHDTVQLELQVMDGSKVIHSEDATVHYVALLTAAENSWKVRVLEAVPAF
ncbi:MAG TPA: hypothetical protein VMD98_04585 [Bryocella sp.]|nr:hypothetical protein [Bryocella sp.]